MITWEAVQKEFTYIEKGKDDNEDRVVVTLLPELDFMLGLADLTGELMRRTINCITSGEADESLKACRFIQHMFTGFLGENFDCLNTKCHINIINIISGVPFLFC